MAIPSITSDITVDAYRYRRVVGDWTRCGTCGRGRISMPRATGEVEECAICRPVIALVMGKGRTRADARLFVRCLVIQQSLSIRLRVLELWSELGSANRAIMAAWNEATEANYRRATEE